MFMNEVRVPRRGFERLMDGFARSEWREGECGELFAEDGFRRFEYDFWIR